MDKASITFYALFRRAVAHELWTTMDSKNEPELDLREYARQLQQAIREADGAGMQQWRTLIEQGLARAYRAGDVVALCDVVQAIVSILDAQGRQRDAVSEIEHAISLARAEPNALAMLLSMKATFQATSGATQAALESVAEAERVGASATLEFARAKVDCNCLVVRYLALESWSGIPPQLSLIEDAGMRASDRLFLLSFFIPFGFSLGRRSEMHPWLRMFRVDATDLHHDYRIGDAAVRQASPKTQSTVPLTLLRARICRGGTGSGRSRQSILEVRAQGLRRDWAACQAALSKLLRARRRAGHASLDTSGGFEALCEAWLGDGDPNVVSCEPPPSVHLLNLPSVLAAGEAIAAAGTRAAAADWSDWYAAAMPERVVTSIEWPVSVARVRALLLLRCGDVNAARKQLERAVDIAAEGGYSIEMATAQLQLAEVLRQGSPSIEQRAASLRREATSTLRAAKIDSSPIAYEAAHIHPLGRNSRAVPQLTTRELEVLVALSRGSPTRLRPSSSA